MPFAPAQAGTGTHAPRRPVILDFCLPREERIARASNSAEPATDILVTTGTSLWPTGRYLAPIKLLHRERAMTTRSNIASLVGLAVALVFAGTGGAAAELQECFRDGYLCSVKCDQAHLDRAASAACQAKCDADEKVCISTVAASRRPSATRYFSTTTLAKPKPLTTVRQAAR